MFSLSQKCITLLGYVIKPHLHTHKDAQRGNGRWGTQIIPCPSSSQAHHRSQQPITGPSAEAQRSTGMHSGRQEPKLRTRRKGPPVQDTPKAVPGEPSAPWSRRETHHHASSGALCITLQAQKGGCLGVQDTLCDAGKEHFRIAQDLLQDVQGRNQKWEKGGI